MVCARRAIRRKPGRLDVLRVARGSGAGIEIRHRCWRRPQRADDARRHSAATAEEAELTRHTTDRRRTGQDEQAQRVRDRSGHEHEHDDEDERDDDHSRQREKKHAIVPLNRLRCRRRRSGTRRRRGRHEDGRRRGDDARELTWSGVHRQWWRRSLCERRGIGRPAGGRRSIQSGEVCIVAARRAGQPAIRGSPVQSGRCRRSATGWTEGGGRRWRRRARRPEQARVFTRRRVRRLR